MGKIVPQGGGGGTKIYRKKLVPQVRGSIHILVKTRPNYAYDDFLTLHYNIERKICGYNNLHLLYLRLGLTAVRNMIPSTRSVDDDRVCG